MSMELKSRDLLAAGWVDDRRLPAALRRARELAAGGLARTAVFSRLAEEYPKAAALLERRETPAPLAEAVEPSAGIDGSAIAEARRRMVELLQMPVVRRGTLMPDTCPVQGGTATMPVGGAIETENAIIPGAHSSDICCSMFATFFSANHPVRELMDHLQSVTHFGPGGRPRHDHWDSAVLTQPVWDNPFLTGLQERACAHLGTQGDGNHFAFLGQATFREESCRRLAAAGYGAMVDQINQGGGHFQVLVTHHGSRGLGADVFKRGQLAARKWCDLHATDIPAAAAWLPADSAAGRDYWEALQYVGRWTRENHALIHAALLRRVGLRAAFQIGNEHNFVWRRGEHFVHGKGATPAWCDAAGRPLLGLIPLNMAREVLVVLGRSNEAFLSFAPHGAGRNRSRGATLQACWQEVGSTDPAAMRHLLERHTSGLDVRWYSGTSDVSESPLGYKDADAVRAQIDRFGLAQVVAEVQPQGCIMAGVADELQRETVRREKDSVRRAQRREGNAAARQWESD